MAARTWLPRLLIVALAAGLAVLAVWLRGYMRPEAIRRQLLDQFQAKFPRLRVEIGSAHLKLFGGIAVHDLSLSRPDAPDAAPFLTVPSATLHPDKELLHGGRVVIRRVEVERARLTVERGAGGFAEWADLFAAPDQSVPSQPPPAVVVKDSRVRYLDTREGALPPLEAAIDRAEILPGPGGATRVELHGSAPETGPFRLAGTYSPIDKRASLRFDLPGADLAGPFRSLVARVCPEAAPTLAGATGTLSAGLDVRADLSGPAAKLTHGLDLTWRGGSYPLPGLGLAAEKVEASATFDGELLTLRSARASLGGATVRVTGHLPLTPGSVSPQAVLASSARFDATVEGLDASPDLFRRLPPELAPLVETAFAPRGPFDVRMVQQPSPKGGVDRVAVLTLRGMGLTYEHFRYPLRDATGTITVAFPQGATPRAEFDGAATVQGKPVRVKGWASGRPGEEIDLDLTIKADGLALDDGLIAALPDDYPAFVRRLGASAEGDVVATIRRDAKIRAAYGPKASDKTFDVRVRRGSMRFDQFPYALTDVSGRLLIKTLPDRPTHLPGSTAAGGRPAGYGSILFEDFCARHGAAVLRLSGRREAGPGGGSIGLDVAATDLDIDDGLKSSLRALRLDSVVEGVRPEGRVNARMRVKVLLHEGAPFDPKRDLHVGLALAGLKARPSALPVTLTDLSARMGYADGRLTILDASGRHGAARLALPSAEVLFLPGGGRRVSLQNFTVANLAFDAELLAALPYGLRRAVESLRPRGGMALRLTEAGVELPPDAPRPAVVHALPVSYTVAPTPAAEVVPPANGASLHWDGTLFLDDANLQTGVSWEGVRGEVSCRGSFAAGRLGAVTGNASFREGRVLKQPLRKASARFEIDPRNPDAVTLPWINAELYGGELGGQALIDVSGPARFDLKLNATRIRLSELARHHDLGPKLRLEGLATAELFLSNRDPDGLTTQPGPLQGSGSLKVADGKLFNLPLTLEILRALRGSAPDETLFEDAEILFAVRNNRVKIGQLDLIGNALSVGGEGEIDLDTQKYHLELYSVWSNLVRKVPATEGVEAVFAALSKNLFKLKVDGTFGGPLDVRKEMVPALVEPVKRLIGLMNGPAPAPPLRRTHTP
jgi:hypothetical protein